MTTMQAGRHGKEGVGSCPIMDTGQPYPTTPPPCLTSCGIQVPVVPLAFRVLSTQKPEKKNKAEEGVPKTRGDGIFGTL